MSITPSEVFEWLKVPNPGETRLAGMRDVVAAVEGLALVTMLPSAMYDLTGPVPVPLAASARNPALNLGLIMQAARLDKRSASPEGVAGVNDFGVVRISRYDPDIETMLAPFLAAGIL
jgi:hypothetical protein